MVFPHTSISFSVGPSSLKSLNYGDIDAGLLALMFLFGLVPMHPVNALAFGAEEAHITKTSPLNPTLRIMNEAVR
jgi:hypothetical protein